MICSGSRFKTILYSRQPGKELARLNREKYYGCLYELYQLKDIRQPENGHPEGDVFQHSLLVLNEAAKITCSGMVRYAALLHDFGKIDTPVKEQPHHYDHEKKAEPYIKRFSRRLGIIPRWEEAAQKAARLHMKGHYYPRLRPGTKVDLLTEVYRSPFSFEQFCQVLIADARGRGKASYEPHYLQEMVETGNKMFRLYPENSSEDPEKLRVDRCNWIAGNL